MHELFDLTGKVALVTGSSGGLGLTLARGLGEAGATVVLNGRNQQKLAGATEWAKYNVQANGIGPGYFITELTQPLADNPEFDAWLKSRTPAGRWGEPDELIGAAVFLASAASNFVSGQIIFVDGGLLACV